jgi:hypothetical protein
LSTTLTGINIKRNINTESLVLWGGDGQSGSGGAVVAYGNTSPVYPGNVSFFVPNAAKTGMILVASFWGNLASPFLDMKAHAISNMSDPLYPQDASTKAYSDALNTSMRNNISANFPTTSYVDAVNTSMRNNVSANFPTTSTLTAVNDSMRNNVSQYVIAVNNSMKSFAGSHGAATSVSNTAPQITHNLGSTPTGCNANAAQRNTTVTIGAISSVNFNVNLSFTNTTAVFPPAQTVYWNCWVGS